METEIFPLKEVVGIRTVTEVAVVTTFAPYEPFNFSTSKIDRQKVGSAQPPALHSALAPVIVIPIGLLVSCREGSIGK